MKPLVSIITPAYNVSSYIEETIKTVTNQTYKNWEWIIIDDASTDNSLDIIKKNLKDNIILIKNKKNIGPGPSRNKGIKIAKGKYISFLDADDLWDKTKLEKQVNFMEKNKINFSFTGYIFSNMHGIGTGATVEVPKKINYENYLKNTIIWTCTVMINQENINKKNLYMPAIKKGEDGSLWIKLLKIEEYAYGLNEPLAYYRRRKKSLSANKLHAIKAIWYLYRKQEKIPFIKSCYYFTHYLFNTIKKRIK